MRAVVLGGFLGGLGPSHVGELEAGHHRLILAIHLLVVFRSLPPLANQRSGVETRGGPALGVQSPMVTVTVDAGIAPMNPVFPPVIYLHY